MTADSTARPLGNVSSPGAISGTHSSNPGALPAIAAGGLIAGPHPSSHPLRSPRSAAGLLGRQAFPGGPATYVLGILLHFFIATSVAAIYYAASRKLTFLIEHPLVCGLFYGMAVELVMSYIVLPLSALHSRGPYELKDVLLGLIVHMIVIGLPVAYSVRRFAK